MKMPEREGLSGRVIQKDYSKELPKYNRQQKAQCALNPPSEGYRPRYKRTKRFGKVKMCIPCDRPAVVNGRERS